MGRLSPGAMGAMRNRWFRASLIFGAVATGAPALIADMKIAVIDSQRTIIETEDGLRMQATLKKVFDERQREIDKRQNDLQAERAELEKQRGVMSQEALMQRAEKWQQEAAVAQQMFADYQRELQKKQNELMQPILAQALRVVQRIATDEGYSMVIEKQAVPYVRADLDLTDRVITAYNEAAGKLPPATKPAPAKAAPAKPATK
jgi:outer membrane protein